MVRKRFRWQVFERKPSGIRRYIASQKLDEKDLCPNLAELALAGSVAVFYLDEIHIPRCNEFCLSKVVFLNHGLKWRDSFLPPQFPLVDGCPRDMPAFWVPHPGRPPEEKDLAMFVNDDEFTCAAGDMPVLYRQGQRTQWRREYPLKNAREDFVLEILNGLSKRH